MKKILLVLGLLCLTVAPAMAVVDEQIDYDDSSNVIFGNIKKKEIYSLNNYAAPAQSSGASVDIITREDIKGQNTPELSQLLNQTMGVTFGQGSGGYGQPSKLIIRGSDRVMFTVDGVRIDDVSGTARTTNLSNFLSTDDIERIEVIRGPQGTIAGHNATGGMVAMRTRRGSGRLQMEAQSLFGNYGYFKERFAIMGGNEKFDHYTAINWFKTDDGTWLEHHGRRGKNNFNNLSLVGNYGMRFLDGKAELRNVAKYSRGRKDLGMNLFPMYGAIPGDLDYDYAIRQDFSDVLTWTHNVNKRYDYNITTSVYNNHYDVHYNPSSADYSHYRYETNGTRFDIGTQHNYQLFDWNKISAGYNFEVENYRLQSAGVSDWGYWLMPTSQYKRGHTLQHDVYIQDAINIKDILFIRGGARYSYNSRYGSWVSPNASAALVLPTFKLKGAKTTFRGSWGMNRNTPTLYQRFGDGSWVYENADLNPERMQAWDAGVNQSFMDGKLSFDFGYFQSYYKDYIGYDSWNLKYTNLNSVTMKGYEGKVTWQPNDKFKFVVNYTYTDANNDDYHQQVPLVSRNRINGSIVWTPFERLSAYVGVEGGDARNYDMQGTKKLPAYVDANIGATVRLFTVKDVSMYLQGDIYNLLNQKIACGYYTAGGGGRIFRPGINFRLGVFLKYNLPEKKQQENI